MFFFRILCLSSIGYFVDRKFRRKVIFLFLLFFVVEKCRYYLFFSDLLSLFKPTNFSIDSIYYIFTVSNKNDSSQMSAFTLRWSPPQFSFSPSPPIFNTLLLMNCFVGQLPVDKIFSTNNIITLLFCNAAASYFQKHV